MEMHGPPVWSAACKRATPHEGGLSPPPLPVLLTAPFTRRTVARKPTRLPPPPTAPHPCAAAHDGRRPVCTAHTASTAAVATPPPECSPPATPPLRSSLQRPHARYPTARGRRTAPSPVCAARARPLTKVPSRGDGTAGVFAGVAAPTPPLTPPLTAAAAVTRVARGATRRTACRCGCSCTMSMRVPSQSPPTGALTPPPSGAARGGGWRAGVAGARGGGVTALLAAVWAPGCTGVRREGPAGGVLAGGMARASGARMGGLCWPATQIKQPPTSFRQRGRPLLLKGGQATSTGTR